MKVVVSTRCGGPESLTLEDWPEPTAGPGEVMLEIHAVGVNYPDALIIEDKYQFRPARPFAPGSEAAGIVRSVGPDVSGLSAGDRVMTKAPHGCMSESLVAKAQDCIRLPGAMPLDTAAALQFTYGTSWHALKQRAGLRAGETLLVLGAAGGVGLAAVQLGAAVGARVVAAVSSEEKAALVRANGADEVLIYPPDLPNRASARALAEPFKALCGKHGADVVYDAVGGLYSEAALRAIAWEGRFLVVGFPAGVPSLPLNLPLLKSCSIIGVFWGAWAERNPQAHEENMRELFALYDQGKIAPHISSRHSLADAARAITELTTRKAMGKIILTCDRP